MITFQIGDKVRHRQTGNTGTIVALPKEAALRDCVLVQWPTSSEPMLAVKRTIEKVQQ